jgi:hypothetical protein
MNSQVLSTLWNFTKVVFKDVQKADYVFRAIRLLKISLKRLRLSSFFRCPGCSKWVRIAFRHFHTSFHRLHQSYFLRLSEWILWDLTATVLLKTSLKRHHQSRFFWCSRCRKWDRMAFRHLEISPHWLHQSHFIWYPEGRLWVFGAVRLLRNQFRDFVQKDFLNAENLENDFELPLDTLRYCFIDINKIAFWDVRKADYEFSGPFAYLNHHLSECIEVAFFDSQDAENCSYGLSHLEPSLLRLQHCRFLVRSEGRLWIFRAIRLLKIFVKELRPSIFFRCPGRK